MKKLTAIIALVSAFVLNIQAANFVTLMNGYSTTNVSAPLNGGTNSSGIYTNTFQVGQVPGASNVVFQLASSSGQQPYNGTNGYLPSSVVSLQGNYPGTLYGPQNFTTIICNGSIMSTNASSTAVVFRFATSVDAATPASGSTSVTLAGGPALWVTNYAVLTLTIPVNSFAATQPVTNTIATGGWTTLALQAIENPGAAALTNIVIEVNGKPGL